MRRVHRAIGMTSVVVAAIVCPATGSGATTRRPGGTITVSAAASLTDAFETIGAEFEQTYRRSDITFNFGSSSTLVTQVEGGASADVFASADRANMDKLVAAGTVTDSPTVFARNQMMIAVKPGNPRRVRSLSDLAKLGTIALCGATVPCGIYGAHVLARAGVTIPERRITRGIDAKATLGAVSPGDADAALVYATDVRAAGRTVEGVTIPDAQNVVAVYPIARLASSGNPRLAKAFVAYVAGRAGQKILARFGFRAP